MKRKIRCTTKLGKMPDGERENEAFLINGFARFTTRILERFPDQLENCLVHVFEASKGEAEAAWAFWGQHAPALADESLLDPFVEFDDLEDWAHAVNKIRAKSPAMWQRRFHRFILERLRNLMKANRVSDSCPLAVNLKAIQEMLRLNRREADLLMVLYLMRYFPPAVGMFDRALDFDLPIGQRYLAAALGVDRFGLSQLLNGRLSQCGVIDFHRSTLSLKESFLPVLDNPSPESIRGSLFQQVSKKTVPLDYHLVPSEVLTHLRRLLLSLRGNPNHLLLYGEPGTGKSSFAHGLAADLGLTVYEIVSDEKNRSENRRAAIRACLNLVGRGRRTVVLVDEADNLLNTANSWLDFGETMDKGWLNQIMDEPGICMVWITNEIDDIEDSVLRRFSYSLYFPTMNETQRERLWDQVINFHGVHKFLTPKETSGLARRFKVSAAVMDLAVRKAKDAGYRSPKGFARAVRLALEAHVALLHGGQAPRNRDQVEGAYSLEGLNLDCDLSTLLTQVEGFDRFLRHGDRNQNACMNMLFYGPPGSGKSEMSRHLAQRLGREAIVKRASDLLSKYVGESEQQVARAFHEAERDGAVLVIDEVDGFLYSRDKAMHTWEASLVNELLTQLERFRGILICTTNRLKDLDQATLRRFAVKVRFNYLSPDGNQIFYQRLLAPLVGSPLGQEERFLLMHLPKLTPGDFKVIRDNFMWVGNSSHRAMLEALQRESLIKVRHGGEKSIGFFG